MTGKEAMKAAKAIREYCRSKPFTCKGCIFYGDSGCKLNDPDHLPETWKLEDKDADSN